MTDLRTAAQQALEALEFFRDTAICSADTEAASEAIAALRAALAEPVQEPVAWIQPDHLQKARVAPFLCRVEPTQRCVDFVPLYTTPSQRKPLTQEEIGRVWPDNGAGIELSRFSSIARAVEAKHGIKESP